MQLLDKLPLNGHKSWIGGVAMIVIGVASFLISLVSPDNAYGISLLSAVEAISVGLGIIGIAHKVDKAGRAATWRDNVNEARNK